MKTINVYPYFDMVVKNKKGANVRICGNDALLRFLKKEGLYARGTVKNRKRR